MNLDITWTEPTPVPTCGYRLLFRRNSDPSYTEIDTSGTSSTIPVERASYEGKIISDCCSESISTGTPFGVNGYALLDINLEISGTALILTLTSPYVSPYDTIISINYTVDSVPMTFEFTLPSNTDYYYHIIAGSYSGAVVLLEVTATPIFDNGGLLQQLDPVSTPVYAQFYWGDQSVIAWNGAPISLPSFTLTRFVVTEVDVDLTTVLAGRLDISYILSEYFMTSFTSLEFEVYDDTTLIGSTIVSTGPLGARTASINLVKGANSLSTSTVFIMQAVWPDTSIIDTKTFYLPTF
jgi:hypothetical protein